MINCMRYYGQKKKKKKYKGWLTVKKNNPKI